MLDVQRDPRGEPPEDEYVEVKAEAVHCVLGRDMAGMREQLALLDDSALRGFSEQMNWIISEISRQLWGRQVKASQSRRLGLVGEDGGHDNS